jgi:2-C-methyl-D-erythritol 4-phosphate cytidylyltransferase
MTSNFTKYSNLPMPKVAVIMPAAGASRRFRDSHYKKPFAPLAGRAVWLHSAEKFLNRSDVKQVIVVIAEEDVEEFNRKFGANIAIMGVDVCKGGKERSDSVQNALAKVKDDVDLVAIHDAARPCLAEKWIDEVFAAAAKDGAALLAVPEPATLKRVSQGKIVETVNREGLWQAQTPQVFRRDLIMKAYVARGGKTFTDDAQLIEQMGQAVTVVEGSPLNLKITTRDDLKLAEQVLKVLPKPKLDGFANPFAGDDLWR